MICFGRRLHFVLLKYEGCCPSYCRQQFVTSYGWARSGEIYFPSHLILQLLVRQLYWSLESIFPPSFVAMSAFGITSTSVAVYDSIVIRSSSISSITSSFPLLFLIGLVGVAWYLLSGKSNTCKAARVDTMTQTEPYVPKQYGCCLHEELMQLCIERGLRTTRTKSPMVQFLAEYDARNLDTCACAVVDHIKTIK